MPYTPKTWENKPSTASPINATNLNHMEGGIKTNDDNIVDAQNAILTLQGKMLQAQGDISALETLVDSIFPVDTETGNPAVITDAFSGACKSLKLTLEPIQSGSGTPSPQNVRPISGKTQSAISRYGKNLTPLPTLQGLWLTADGIFETRSTWVATTKFSVLPGKTYTASATRETRSFAVLYWDENGNYIGYDANTTFGAVLLTFTTPSNCATIALEVADRYNGAGIVPSDVTDLILCPGSTAATYEPYIEPTSITRTYGTTIYGGSDDVMGDGATSTKKLNEINGGFSVAGSGAFYKDGITDISDIPSLCNIYPIGAEVQGAGGANDHPKTLCWQKNGLQSLRLCVYDSDFADVATFNTALAQTPMQVIFDLATPTSIPLTAQNITLLHGDNVLATDADSIEASYSADIALYIAKKIAEGSQGNRSLSKGGSGDEESKEEVKEEEKKEEIEIKEAEPLTKEVR